MKISPAPSAARKTCIVRPRTTALPVGSIRPKARIRVEVVLPNYRSPKGDTRYLPEGITMNLLELPTRDDDGNLRAVVETPCGSLAKIKYDAKLGFFELARTLVQGVVY